jgi:hypothetical protein
MTEVNLIFVDCSGDACPPDSRYGDAFRTTLNEFLWKGTLEETCRSIAVFMHEDWGDTIPFESAYEYVTKVKIDAVKRRLRQLDEFVTESNG